MNVSRTVDTGTPAIASMVGRAGAGSARTMSSPATGFAPPGGNGRAVPPEDLAAAEGYDDARDDVIGEEQAGERRRRAGGRADGAEQDVAVVVLDLGRSAGVEEDDPESPALRRRRRAPWPAGATTSKSAMFGVERPPHVRRTERGERDARADRLEAVVRHGDLRSKLEAPGLKPAAPGHDHMPGVNRGRAGIASVERDLVPRDVTESTVLLAGDRAVVAATGRRFEAGNRGRGA